MFSIFIFVFRFGSDRPSGLIFFVPALFISILMPLFLPSSVSLSYFIFALPMHECLGKHSRLSSPFPIAILNGTLRVAPLKLSIIRIKKNTVPIRKCSGEH